VLDDGASSVALPFACCLLNKVNKERMNRSIVSLTFCLVCHVAVASNVSISTVPVAASAGDPFYFPVDYDYRIGTYEVTNAQYAAFLNAKAASDPHQLFNSNMSSNPWGGISRTGSEGSYSYVTKPNMADKPVNYVSWYDSARFINWLNNGQGSGDTEHGAYLLTGVAYLDGNSRRNAGATWVLPNAEEWGKAAFVEHVEIYDPEFDETTVQDIWNYATRSNTAPAVATADSAGNISNPGNVANYANGADWNGQDGNVTTVGSGGPLSVGPYGTYDQAGNVSEWGDGPNIPDFGLYEREFFGSGFQSTQAELNGSFVYPYTYATYELRDLGFRVAQLVKVPEPSSCMLASVGLLALMFCARRRAHRSQ
jgi:formylglycine-generating enzyme required for sulfatase activity